MTIDTPYVIAPVLAPAEVVVFFSAGVTPEAGFGNLLRWLAFERNDFGWIAFFDMCFAWTMTRFAAGHLLVPATKPGQLRVRSVREGLELILVTVFARIAADVILALEDDGLDLIRLSGLRRCPRG